MWGFLLASSATTGVDVDVAVAVGASIAGGGMEVGLLLLAEPSGCVSGKFSWSLIKTLTLLARESVSGVSSDGRINSWPLFGFTIRIKAFLSE